MYSFNFLTKIFLFTLLNMLEISHKANPFECYVFYIISIVKYIFFLILKKYELDEKIDFMLYLYSLY